MRAISIAGAIKDLPVCFMGSNLQPYADLIGEEIECVHLPFDLPVSTDAEHAAADLDFLHYAPLGLEGIRGRTAVMTAYFQRKFPIILIVDVSVEVTMLARLCGIPTIVMLQHGKRDDTPHINAYQSAELLIAPFAESMAAPEISGKFSGKTVYSGGFSRYSKVDKDTVVEQQPDHIAVLLGQGGTSIDTEFILFLARQCHHHYFHVIGYEEEGAARNNIIWHGRQDDPLDLLRTCAVVIGNAGHNTVMEMADLNKHFICIPEERPFEEQLEKAAMLTKNGNALVIAPEDLYVQDWPGILKDIIETEPNWEGVTQNDALGKIAEAIKLTSATIYGTVQ
jgi:hypothetical protein